jgi:hypothetical protein
MAPSLLGVTQRPRGDLDIKIIAVRFVRHKLHFQRDGPLPQTVNRKRRPLTIC